MESFATNKFVISHVRPKEDGSDRDRARRSIDPGRERTKLPLSTSKYCPHCFYEYGGKLQKRKRKWKITGPLKIEDCTQGLAVLQPRVSSKKAWWNKGFIRWLIAPPDPPKEGEWFEIETYATCPVHRKELVHELTGVRQFGRIRRVLIFIRGSLTDTIEWIIPVP